MLSPSQTRALLDAYAASLRGTLLLVGTDGTPLLSSDGSFALLDSLGLSGESPPPPSFSGTTS